jgi:hypothetical protein
VLLLGGRGLGCLGLLLGGWGLGGRGRGRGRGRPHLGVPGLRLERAEGGVEHLAGALPGRGGLGDAALRLLAGGGRGAADGVVRETRGDEEDPRVALLERAAAGRWREREGAAVGSGGAGRADEGRWVLRRDAREVRDGDAAGGAGRCGPGRGDGRVARGSGGSGGAGGEEVEAGGAEGGRAVEEDAGGAEEAEDALVTEVVERPGVAARGAAVAAAAALGRGRRRGRAEGGRHGDGGFKRRGRVGGTIGRGLGFGWRRDQTAHSTSRSQRFFFSSLTWEKKEREKLQEKKK